MLDFWIVKPDEPIVMFECALEEPPDRKPDLSLQINAFHRILELGLEQVAADVGLSFFNDALIEIQSSEKILVVLLRIDVEFNPAGAQTETRAMIKLFSQAITLKRNVVVVCD